jgi:filamentous hemagglutinin
VSEWVVVENNSLSPGHDEEDIEKEHGDRLPKINDISKLGPLLDENGNPIPGTSGIGMGGVPIMPIGRGIIGPAAKANLVSSANEPINGQGMSAAARAREKHAGRSDGTFEPLKGNVFQKNEAATKFVNEVLNNPGTIETQLSRGGVEYRLPSGQGLRYNSDGSFSGFLDPKR